MGVTPYAIVFLAGIFVGAYAANLRFRTRVNEGFRKLFKKASRINVEKGFK